MGPEDILRCPRTGNKLRFDQAARVVRVERSELTFPIIDGIIDFCPGPPDPVAESYDAMAPRYDSYITSATLPMRICNSFVWGISDDNTSTDKVLSFVPARFDGVLVDVPVGTAVFTAGAYASLPDATIIAVDSSMAMLRKAAERLRENNLKNVCLVHADAADLPIADSAADIVLSMNGLHVFTDKIRVLAQISRITRPGGKLLGCAYVRGFRRLSDWFVKRFGVRKGYFSEPFLSLEEIARQLEAFTFTQKGNIKSLAYFEATKAVK